MWRRSATCRSFYFSCPAASFSRLQNSLGGAACDLPSFFFILWPSSSTGAGKIFVVVGHSSSMGDGPCPHFRPTAGPGPAPPAAFAGGAPGCRVSFASRTSSPKLILQVCRDPNLHMIVILSTALPQLITLLDLHGRFRSSIPSEPRGLAAIRHRIGLWMMIAR